MGVMQGDTPGVDIRVPVATDEATTFEGVAMTGYTNEQTMTGEIKIRPHRTVGLLVWGRAWVRIPDSVEPEYGEALFLICDGADAGLFTNDDGGGANLVINGRFIGPKGTGNVAPIELYKQNS